MSNLSIERITEIQNKYANNAFDMYNKSHGAIFSKEKHKDCSEGYVPISTAMVLSTLLDEGVVNWDWELLKQEGKSITGAYIVAVYFEVPGYEHLGKFALYIINSLDRTKGFKLAYGFLNGACLNGCIWGNVLEELYQRHYGKEALLVQDKVVSLVKSLKLFMENELSEKLDVINQMRNTKVPTLLADEIASKAFDIRISTMDLGKKVAKEDVSIEDLDVKAIRTSKRDAFLEQNLWSVYQSVHENLGGNFDYSNRVDTMEKVCFTVVKNAGEENEERRNSSIRKSTNIADKIKFNEDLMKLMRTYVDLPCEESMAA